MIENSREKKKKALRIDWFTIIVVLALVAIGLVSIASIMASLSAAAKGRSAITLRSSILNSSRDRRKTSL